MQNFRYLKYLLGVILFSPYRTNKRLINFFRLFVEWKILRRSVLTAYPLKLTICTGNICRLHCKLCPTGLGQSGRKKGLMAFETFKRIMDETGQYLYEVDLFNWGEPLLNPQIFLMIRYAKKFKMRVTVSSTLMDLTEKKAAELIDSGVDRIKVSLFGASQGSVGKQQSGLDFEKTLQNISSIVTLRDRKGGRKPLIWWRYCVNRYNEDEIAEARKMAKGIKVDRLELVPIRCDMGNELLMDSKSQIDNIRDWLPSSKDYLMYDPDRGGKRLDYKGDCFWLWTQSCVNWDGSVSPCDAVWYEKFDFGNIMSDGFMDLWNNTKYVDARRIFLKNEAGGHARRNICHICCLNHASIC